MASASSATGLVPEDKTRTESIWRSPLVFAALAVTSGVVVDRQAGLPFAIGLLAGVGFLAAFLIARLGKHDRLALV